MGLFHDHGHGNRMPSFDREKLRGMQSCAACGHQRPAQREPWSAASNTGWRPRRRCRTADLNLCPWRSTRVRRNQHVPQGRPTARTSTASAATKPRSSARRSTWAPPIRPGCRFGPQAVRRISALYDGYSRHGVDLVEELDLCDAGDVFVIPSNIEKCFDQIDRAVSYVAENGRIPGGHRRRPLHWLSRCASAGQVRRRQRRDHPPRPPRRHPGARHGRADAHDAVVPCHQHRERSATEPGADGHRRLVRLRAPV